MAARRAGAPVLIGGIVLDVQARTAGPGDVQRGGSVPGHVRQAPGGVARNVAHALAALTRTAPLLVSTVGDDAAGSWLLAHWAGRGLPTHGILRVAGASTPCVSIVFDRGGEVAAAVADVGLLERELTPELVHRHMQAIRTAPALLVDGNLQPLAIAEACAAAAAAGVPVVFEPVSAAKAARAARALHCIDILTPNAAELAALAAEVRRVGALARARSGGGTRAAGAARASPAPVAGAAPAGREAAAAALAAALPDLQAVLGAGAAHVLLTLGPLGAALCRLGRCGASGAVLVAHMPALPAEVANCLGAGDCLAAGVLMRLMEGGSPVDALAHGLVRRSGLFRGRERALSAPAVPFYDDRQDYRERPDLPVCRRRSQAVCSIRETHGVRQAAARHAVESVDSVPPALSAEGVRAGARAARASLAEWALPLSAPGGPHSRL